MGLQSSRIIWGRDRMPGANAPQPVELYDPNGTIYIGGNYAIHSDGTGSIAEDYHLYLCGAAETGGVWNSEDWKLQKGVKNWYLVDFKNFKKGARVIKSDTNGDFETLKLYKCKNGMSTPNIWKPEEWEVVYQDVGVAYQARDHKEVYYNENYHKLMYYLPPSYDYANEFDSEVTYYKGDRCMVGETKYEYRGKEPYQGEWANRNPNDWIVIDERILEEIMMFDENKEYHYEDYVIRIKPGVAQEKALYQYINHTPRSGTWNPSWWMEITSVSEYEAYKAYAKDDRCIKKHTEIWDCRVVEFQSGTLYNSGNHCLHYVNKNRIDPDIANWTASTLYNGGDRCAHDGGIYQFNVTLPAPVAGPWNPANWDYLRPTYPDDIRDRIIGDEQLYGLYRCNRPVSGLWDDSEWDLLINEQITLKGHIYNTNRLPITEFQFAKNYVEGELCIWSTAEDSQELGLNAAKQDIFNCNYRQAPPNETYWQSLNEINETPDSYYVYKAKTDISASDNTHFQRENWLIVDQKVLPDDGDYGVIWEKLGVPGGPGGVPFYAPIIVKAKYTRNNGDPLTWSSIRSCIDHFFPYMGKNTLNIGTALTMEISSNTDWTVVGGVNRLLQYDGRYIGIFVSSNINSLRGMEDREGNSFASHYTMVIFSLNGQDFNRIVIDKMDSGPASFESSSGITALPCHNGFLYLKNYEDGDPGGAPPTGFKKSYLHKVTVSIDGSTMMLDDIIRTFLYKPNLGDMVMGDISELPMQFMGRGPGGNYIWKTNTHVIPNIFFYVTEEIVVFALETASGQFGGHYLTGEFSNVPLYDGLLHAIKSDGTVYDLGLYADTLRTKAYLQQYDPYNIYFLNEDSLDNLDLTVYTYTQEYAEVSPAIAEANIRIYANALYLNYGSDFTELLDIDYSVNRTPCIFSDFNGDRLYRYEIKQGDYVKNNVRYAYYLAQLRVYSGNSPTPTIIELCNYVEEYTTGYGQFYSDDFQIPGEMYYSDDRYMYCINTDNYTLNNIDYVSDSAGFWKVSLYDGTKTQFQKCSTIAEISNLGLIEDIKPYKNQPIYLKKNGTSFEVDSLNIWFTNKKQLYYYDIGLDVDTHVLTLAIDPQYYKYAAYGASSTGYAARSNQGLIISDSIEIRPHHTGQNISVGWGDYGIVIYIPIFTGEKISLEGAFFWMNDEWDTSGGPYYGGPQTPGFKE